VLKKEEKTTLLFEVMDTGIGITPEVRERLFKPFSQGDISTARKYGGSGLGLAISKRLVDSMGGEIDAESLPGRGSRFWFTLMLEECEAPALKLEPDISPEMLGARILCVDDNSINREIIKRQINYWKMNCDVAVNAAEALSMLKRASEEKNPYLLTIIDLVMPGMSGIELIEVIRELKDIASIPIVLMSSLGSSLTIKELEKLEISKVLTKPLRQGKLYECITTVLKWVQETGGATISPIETAAAQQKKKRSRILLAEDNVINQKVTLRMLDKLGYQADVAENGLEALKAFEATPYNLILMDCQMPEMDGYTTAEEIRKIEKATQAEPITIIAITAHALKGDRKKCLLSGMDDYISKPIDMKVLGDALDRWLINVESTNNEVETMSQEIINEVKPDAHSIIDMNRMRSIFGDDFASIHEFIKNFITATSELLYTLHDAIQAHDSQLVKDILHRLKGSAGNSGVMKIQELSMQAEEKLSHSDWKAVEGIDIIIEDVFKNLKIEAEEMLR